MQFPDEFRGTETPVMINLNSYTSEHHWRLFTATALLMLSVFIFSPVRGQVVADPPSYANGTTASLTWSHSVGSGSNRLLIVGVSIRKANRTVSSVTYGGASLSRVGF